jgi:hypothetical protein
MTAGSAGATELVPESILELRSKLKYFTDYRMEINLETGEWFLNKFLPYLGLGSIIVMDNVRCRSTVFNKAPNKEPSNIHMDLPDECTSLCHLTRAELLETGIGITSKHIISEINNSGTLSPSGNVQHLTTTTLIWSQTED